MASSSEVANCIWLNLLRHVREHTEAGKSLLRASGLQKTNEKHTSCRWIIYSISAVLCTKKIPLNPADQTLVGAGAADLKQKCWSTFTPKLTDTYFSLKLSLSVSSLAQLDLSACHQNTKRHRWGKNNNKKFSKNYKNTTSVTQSCCHRQASWQK